MKNHHKSDETELTFISERMYKGIIAVKKLAAETVGMEAENIASKLSHVRKGLGRHREPIDTSPNCEQ